MDNIASFIINNPIVLLVAFIIWFGMMVPFLKIEDDSQQNKGEKIS